MRVRHAEALRTAHGPLLHLVLIRLSDPARAPELSRETQERLSRIPSVIGLQVGRPEDIGRAGVDLDFDVGIVVSFRDVQRYRDYLEHPEHVALLQAWKPRWSAIRIFDLSVPLDVSGPPEETGTAATR
ncbi:MAG: Dabb family protein [Planctomycetota bacterium]